MNKKLSDLIPDHANANKGTQRGRAALESSLRQYGAGRSILVDRNGHIIAGNKTAEVAADIGMDNVIVVQTDGTQIIAVQRTDLDIDSETGRGLAYADNRVGELSLNWDAERVLADLDAGVNLSGLFDKKELDGILSKLESSERVDDVEPQVDRAEELRQKWQVEPGQLWQLGEHRLICGDCTDKAVMERLMSGEKSHLLIADPEYDAPMDWLAIDIFDSIPHWLIMAGDRQHAQSAKIHAERFNQFLIVYFRQFSWNLNVYIPILQHLCIAHYRSKNAKNYNLNGLHSVIECASKFDRKVEHPHAKQIEIITPLVNSFSPSNALVLDLFSGSGTTLMACEQVGRRCLAIEISPAYVAVGLQRWHVATGKMPASL